MIDKILAGIAVFMLLIVVGTIGHNEWSQQEFSVIVSLKDNEDPFVAMRQIMPVDSRITVIRELENNKYFLKIKTKRAKVNLLEWFMQSSKVENAEIPSDLKGL